MTKRNDDDVREQRKQSRLHKLGTNNPRCAICGIGDWRVIEEHHPDTRKRDDLIVLVCANDHRILTHDQKEHATELAGSDPFLSQVGNFLLGLADMLRIIVERMYEFGFELLERANAVSSKAGART